MTLGSDENQRVNTYTLIVADPVPTVKRTPLALIKNPCFIACGKH